MFYYIMDIKWYHNHDQTSQSYLPVAHSSVQKFDNNCEIMFMLKMW